MALPLKREVLAAIGGLGLLLRGDPRALLRYDFSESGFWRSFRWPLFALLAYVALMQPDAGELALWGDDALGYALARGAEFLLAWFAYLLLIAALSRGFGLGDRFAVFVVLYNWAQAITTAATLPLLAGTSFGLLGPGILQGWSTALLLAWLYIVARIARIGLGAAWSLALAAAVLDLLVSLLLHRVFDALL
jgi:hypothetical protein